MITVIEAKVLTEQHEKLKRVKQEQTTKLWLEKCVSPRIKEVALRGGTILTTFPPTDVPFDIAIDFINGHGFTTEIFRDSITIKW